MNSLKLFVLMGVSGSGKSLIGKKLAYTLGWNFFDGDAFHPQENINKMKNGIPLNDEDRAPWLQSINLHMKEQSKSSIYACSSLKSKYRKILSENIQDLQFIYLKGTIDIIHQRLQSRSNHFMPIDLLQSQFDDLEEPQNALSIDITKSPSEIISNIIQRIT